MKKITMFLIDSIRPLLGPRGTCIYHVTCRQYARFQLDHKPLYSALPLIFIRIISCNPLTALWMRFRSH